MSHGSGPEGGALAWRGAVRPVAAGPSPDAAWALLGDFCSLHRWVPSLSTCRLVEGAAGRLGCVRHCAGPVNMAAAAAADLGKEEEAGWSRERLVAIDHAARWYSYEVVESNKGFGRYRATVRVEPDPAGCAVAWSFEADPVQGWTLDGFVGFLDKLARGVARRIEEEVVVQRGDGVVCPCSPAC
ncbi:hypothetical protein QOZ80_1BG0081880 [Eleusine coracana subsp. coracana]|nr:hypothetical protein QOZ80_1BG0081880 [Eleusine coracana subsp. coracana]